MGTEHRTVVLDNVSIGYKTRQGTRCVASGISAAILQGELTCLLGRNGVGKSTLMKTMAAFQKKLSGTISIDGVALEDYSANDLAKKLSVVLTERPDVQQMTVREMVAMGRAPYTGFWGRLDADDEHHVATAIAMVGIESLAERLVSTLSDGERQKVMIAKALAQQTPVVCLDEPTAFLDYQSKVETLLLLKRIARQAQKTVFLSTHDVELAIQVADRLWIMQKETGVTIGTPAELAASGMLGRFIESGSGVRFDPSSLTVTVEPDVTDLQ